MEHILQCHELVKSDLVRGQGCVVFDRAGKAFVDFEAGIWCANLGHGHPRITEVIHRQSERLMHTAYRFTTDLVEDAAVAVLSVLRWDDGRCVFLSSGSEAVELGVTISRRLTGRSLMLTLAGAYLSALGSAGSQPHETWYHLALDTCDACPESETCRANCEILSGIPFERLAGFVFDGGNMHGTARFPPVGLIRQIADRIHAAGGLIVANEVTAGMGRTGRWFGFEHYGLRPDIAVLGKALGNGYPVSAVAVRPNVADPLERSGFSYVQSHQSDPLGCAVAEEVIRVIRDERLVERSEEVGSHFLERLRETAIRKPAIREVRGRGLMIVVDLDRAHASAAPVFSDLLERGFIVGASDGPNHLRFYPPLTISLDQIERVVDALSDVLDTRQG